jgi:ribonuclease HI
MPLTPPLIAATDGSALRNPGPAAWCWYISQGSWAAGTFATATNNIAELTAIHQLLEAVPDTRELHIRADSQYCIDALTRWRFGWARKGWVTAVGKPVANADLIRSIAAQLTARRAAVTFVKVRAHQITGGDQLNEAADVRANNAARAQQGGTPIGTGPGYHG